MLIGLNYYYYYYYYRTCIAHKLKLESEALAYSEVGNMASRGGKRGEF